MTEHHQTALGMAREFVRRADEGDYLDDGNEDVYRLWDCLNDMIEFIPEHERIAFEEILAREADTP